MHLSDRELTENLLRSVIVTFYDFIIVLSVFFFFIFLKSDRDRQLPCCLFFFLNICASWKRKVGREHVFPWATLSFEGSAVSFGSDIPPSLASEGGISSMPSRVFQ